MMTHQTVFLKTAVDFLAVSPAQWYLDATFGAGGHTREILRRGGKVLALDYDPANIAQGESAFKKELAVKKLVLVNANFSEITSIVSHHCKKPSSVAGAIFDLGTTSDQLMSGEHGLSIYEDGPLDMRLDASLAVTARDFLLALPERELTRLFWEYGGESESKAVARAIIKRRQSNSHAFERTQELVDLIVRTKKMPRGKIHPATKVFQALRIGVNNELDNLNAALPQAWASLAPNGHLVVIAFHEGEDRAVKRFMNHLSAQGSGKILTKKPMTTKNTAETNPRARSAKLRVSEKIN